MADDLGRVVQANGAPDDVSYVLMRWMAEKVAPGANMHDTATLLFTDT